MYSLDHQRISSLRSVSVSAESFSQCSDETHSLESQARSPPQVSQQAVFRAEYELDRGDCVTADVITHDGCQYVRFYMGSEAQLSASSQVKYYDPRTKAFSFSPVTTVGQYYWARIPPGHRRLHVILYHRACTCASERSEGDPIASVYVIGTVMVISSTSFSNADR